MKRIYFVTFLSLFLVSVVYIENTRGLEIELGTVPGTINGNKTFTGNVTLKSGFIVNSGTIAANGTLLISTATTAGTSTPNLYINASGNIGLGTTGVSDS